MSTQVPRLVGTIPAGSVSAIPSLGHSTHTPCSQTWPKALTATRGHATSCHCNLAAPWPFATPKRHGTKPVWLPNSTPGRSCDTRAALLRITRVQSPRTPGVDQLRFLKFGVRGAARQILVDHLQHIADHLIVLGLHAARGRALCVVRLGDDFLASCREALFVP